MAPLGTLKRPSFTMVPSEDDLSQHGDEAISQGAPGPAKKPRTEQNQTFQKARDTGSNDQSMLDMSSAPNSSSVGTAERDEPTNTGKGRDSGAPFDPRAHPKFKPTFRYINNLNSKGRALLAVAHHEVVMGDHYKARKAEKQLSEMREKLVAADDKRKESEMKREELEKELVGAGVSINMLHERLHAAETTNEGLVTKLEAYEKKVEVLKDNLKRFEEAVGILF